MPYQVTEQRNDSSIGVRDRTKQRLTLALHRRGIYRSSKWSWDWFINQVAIKVEKGKI